MNPDLDLTLQRVIRAPRATVWRAWTDPSQLERWWVPAPTVARVDRLEVRPGGALVTRMSDDGVDFVPHLDALFLVVDELERLAFTNAIDSRWRPAHPEPIAMVAEILLADHPEGTDYRVVVRHGDPPPAPATSRSASSTAGDRSPSSSPRSWSRRRNVPPALPPRRRSTHQPRERRMPRPMTWVPFVEVPGIEPGSSVASRGLLRAQSALPQLGPTGHANEPV